jgi:O-succinylbenzoate synthase
MLKLDRVDLLHVRRRLAHPFRISVGAVSAREFVVLRGFADGLRVWGEANIDARPFYAWETVGTVWSIARDVLLPRVLGRAFDSIDAVRAAWADVRGHDFAKAGIEHLYWDLLGKMQNQSIQQLLGGDGDLVEVGTSHSIFPTTDELIRDIEAALQAGIGRIKIKIQPGWDHRPLAAIREALGDITLMVDANAAYPHEQMDHLHALDQFNLLMIEQPLPSFDLVDHAELARRCRTPLCLDEGAHDFDTVRSAVTYGACDIVNIKVGRVGGLTQSKAIHDFCHARGIPLWCGRRTGAGISMASELALATLPGFIHPSDHGVEFVQENLDQFVDLAQFQRDGGRVRVPTGPGIGVDVDEPMLERLSIRRESFFPASPQS